MGDFINDAQKIMEYGESNFDKNMSLNEIINILLLNYMDPAENILKKIYKKYHGLAVDTFEKSMFRDVYGNESIVSIMKKYKINLSTNFTIDHRYDFQKLIELTYESLLKMPNIDILPHINNILTINSKDRQTPLSVVKMIVQELNPLKTDKISDEYGETGNFIIQTLNMTDNPRRLYVCVKDEYEFKYMNLVAILKNIPIQNIKYGSNINEHSLISEHEKYDIIMGNTDYTNKIKVINPPQYIKKYFEVDTNDSVGLHIQTCLHKLKEGGRCGLIVPQSFLYNNGTNRIQLYFHYNITQTWEYKLRKILLENNIVNKIILLPQNGFTHKIPVALIFFTKGGTTENVVINGKITTMDHIKKNEYSLMPTIKIKISNIQDINSLKYNQIVNSKILSCMINKMIHSNLAYRNIQLKIYSILKSYKKIIINSRIGIVYGVLNHKGYRYIEKLKISIRGADSYTSLKEIVRQAHKNNIKLNMKILLNDHKTLMISI